MNARDRMMLALVDDASLRQIAETRIGLAPLLGASVRPEEFETRQLAFGRIVARSFAVPVYVDARAREVRERVVPGTERWHIDRVGRKAGGTAWIDVLAEINIRATVEATAAPIDRVTTADLFEVLGGATTLAELRVKLEARYPRSVVDALFRRFEIRSLEEFRSQYPLLVEFVARAIPPFDANDPANQRQFTVRLCVLVRPELDVAGALRDVKICRDALEDGADVVPQPGAEVLSPFVFLVMFPAGSVADGDLAGLTRAQVEERVRSVFQAERAFVLFN